MKRILATLLVIAMLMGMALTTTATTTEPTSYTLADLDCTGWWTAHTEGVKLTEEGVTVTLNCDVYDTTTNWGACPIWILYSGDENVIGCNNYSEYFVMRSDNYGWAGAWGNFLNTGDNMADLNALGVNMVGTYGTDWWLTWLDDIKANEECVVNAYLDGNNAIVTMSFATITTTLTVPVDTTKDVYLSLTGQECTLTDINVSNNTTNMLACTGWWSNHSEGIEITETGVLVSFNSTTHSQAANIWNGPLWIAYTADEPAVSSNGYTEYWVQRSDNYGWGTNYSYVTDESNTDWTNFLANLKAGVSGSITAHLDGNHAIITMDLNGLITTVTLEVDTTKPVYLSLTGEACILTDLVVDDHSNTEIKDAAAETCTEDGYTGDTYCADCGLLLETGSPIPAKNHNYGDATYVWADDHSSCTATRVCANDETHVETANASITSVATATCGQDGVIRYTATFTEEWAAEQTAEVEMQATGEHVYANFKERKEATCTEDGYEVYACGCGETKTTVLAHTGHTEGEPVKENEVAASCTEKGSYDTVVYCKTCTAELDRETTTVNANGHTEGEPVKENEVAATCTEKGSYDTVVYCETCEEELDRKNTVTDAKGHSYLNGSCSVCGAEDPNYIEGTLDCPGWWADHTDGIKLTDEGVTVTFKSTTYADAACNWNAPIYVLYSGDEAAVNGAGYYEYWVHRADNYGWAGSWAEFKNTNEHVADLNALGVTLDSKAEEGCWDNWLTNLKAGVEVTIHAELEGDNAVIQMIANGVDYTVTVPVDTTKDVYLSLSGELCTLTNIVVTANETQGSDPEVTEPEATEPEATEPEATEPETTEPEATEPEATEPEAAVPEATVPAAPTVTDLGDVDCTGWWTAHSAGVTVDTDGVTVTMDSKSYDTATNNWNAPIFILYSGDEAKVNGAGYYEYWVHRADNYGWAGGWGNFLNTGANMAELNALGVTVEGAYEEGCWDNWVADLKAGVECTVTAKLVGSNAVVSIECNGVTNTVTVPVDASKPLYLSVSGELCTLSNITATSHKTTTGPSQTGDSIAVFVALMAASAMGIAIIGKKKEF